MLRIRVPVDHPYAEARSVAILTNKPVWFKDPDEFEMVAFPINREANQAGVLAADSWEVHGNDAYDPKKDDFQFPPAGSVSSGTMRPEDLAPRFMGILEEYDPKRAAELTTEFASDGWPYSQAGLGWGDPFEGKQVELAEPLVNLLFEALDEIAPPHCYFGAHAGDGADYGFWSYSEQSLQDFVLDQLAVEEFWTIEIRIINPDDSTFWRARLYHQIPYPWLAVQVASDMRTVLLEQADDLKDGAVYQCPQCDTATDHPERFRLSRKTLPLCSLCQTVMGNDDILLAQDVGIDRR